MHLLVDGGGLLEVVRARGQTLCLCAAETLVLQVDDAGIKTPRQNIVVYFVGHLLLLWLDRQHRWLNWQRNATYLGR